MDLISKWIKVKVWKFKKYEVKKKRKKKKQDNPHELHKPNLIFKTHN